MGKEPTAAELRAKAAKYRALGRASNDDATTHDIFKLAAQLEKQARKLGQHKRHAATTA
jgi:hypothetical protein